jgi:hypothetical protein
MPNLKDRAGGRRAAFAIFVVIPLVIAAGTVSSTLAANASSTSTRLVIPRCKPVQIDEWMAAPSGRFNASRNYTLKVIYTNLGRTCTIPRTYVGVQAVAGKNHSPVGMGSAIPLASFGGSITLRSQHTAAASVFIDSTNAASFRKRCAPKYADAIEVFGFYNGWPVKYFALFHRVLVCTSGDDNIGAGTIALTKKIIVHG